jgi:hypothetical protein
LKDFGLLPCRKIAFFQLRVVYRLEVPNETGLRQSDLCVTAQGSLVHAVHMQPFLGRACFRLRIQIATGAQHELEVLKAIQKQDEFVVGSECRCVRQNTL